MQNVGRGQFNYDVFQAAYDSDPRIQNIVSNFDEKKIDLKDKKLDNIKDPNSGGGDSVSSMAQSAVDLKGI